MITVRFPNGLAVRYAHAGYVSWGTERHYLYRASGGDFIASVPVECAVEFEEGAPVTTLSDNDAIERCANEPHRLKFLPHGVAKRLKEAFRKFDIRTGRWKDK